MSAETIEVPLLPATALRWVRNGGARHLLVSIEGSENLERRLRDVLEKAVARAVRPVLETAPTPARRFRSSAARRFRQFLEIRSGFWPLIAEHLRRHPLDLLKMLHSGASVLRSGQERWTLSPKLNSREAQASWWSLLGAVKTYDLTVRLTRENLLPMITALVEGRVGREYRRFAAGLFPFLSRLDRSTARLEFGLLLVSEMEDAGPLSSGPPFSLACEYAARGAEDQHLLVRRAIRAILPEASKKAPAQETTDLTPQLADRFFTDWVKAVLSS